MIVLLLAADFIIHLLVLLVGIYFFCNIERVKLVLNMFTAVQKSLDNNAEKVELLEALKLAHGKGQLKPAESLYVEKIYEKYHSEIG